MVCVNKVCAYVYVVEQMPTDVDYRVMLTFVEFYSSLLGFVNYKLYTGLNLKYPPQVCRHKTVLCVMDCS